MRIILLEDDSMLGKAIKNALEQENHVVDWVMDYESCEAALKTTQFEILLLDINLPKKSGLDILKKLRLQKNSMPILILTARDSVLQKIEGLDLGADDYLSKPFDLEELFARIRSLVRRSKGIATAILTYKNIELNPANSTVTRNGNRIDLSPKEFMILKFLLENIDKTISKSRLEELLYSWDDSIESNTVEVHIHHLRKKLEKNLIKTVRGFGYTIEKEPA
ncbi:MAG: DNA-binding response regulator [Proteobacteria bacterium]|nr:DNA-binding response regulator [Pseudomonadota bacterium]